MKLRYLLIALTASMLAACSEDDLDSKSIFADETKTVRNEFDTWIEDNYVKPYNIDLKYRFEYKESESKFNVIPADYNKSIALAILTKYLWLEAYEELLGKDFIRTYCPRMIHLVGSLAYEEGKVKLGTAEGGLKITLYNVNNLNYKKPDIEFLNEWFFRTMHHEFTHILHMNKPYPTEFNKVTPSDYQSNSWVNVEDKEALHKGFITPYASSETQDDFAELLSNYITHSQKWWEEQLDEASYQECSKCQNRVSPCLYCQEEGILDENGDGKPDAYCPACDGWGEVAILYDTCMTCVEGYIDLDEDGEYGSEGDWFCPDCGGTNYTLCHACDAPGLSQTFHGSDCLIAKLQIIREWMKTSWGIELDDLRAIVQARSANVAAGKIDLQSLK